MRVRLTRLSNHGNALRTESIEGEIYTPVEIGVPLNVWADSLDPSMHIRWVTTSPVVRVAPTINGSDIWTENTHYLLEVLDDQEEFLDDNQA